MARVVKWLAVLLVAALLAGELALRIMHVCDVPIYLADQEVGYIPAPNQSGRFLRRNDWTFNEHSMGVARPFAPGAGDVLMLGDSIVLGGVWMRQADKPGSQLETLIRRPVWPLSAGSWALQNELVAFLRRPEQAAVGTVVIVSNSGDFGVPSVWRSEFTHPRSKPVSDLAYVLLKKVSGVTENWEPPVTPEATMLWHATLSRFLATYRGRVVWVLYPQKKELGAPSPAFDDLRRRIAGRAEIVDLTRDPQWNAGLYRDSIHPNPRGTALLARRIADRLAVLG